MASLVALGGSLGVLLSGLFQGTPLFDAAALLLGAVALAALASCAWSFGDRFRVDENGLDYENRWLSRGPFAAWHLDWSEVEGASSRRGILFLRARGRSYILDSLEDAPAVCDELERRGLLHGRARAEGQPREGGADRPLP